MTCRGFCGKLGWGDRAATGAVSGAGTGGALAAFLGGSAAQQSRAAANGAVTGAIWGAGDGISGYLLGYGLRTAGLNLLANGARFSMVLVDAASEFVVPIFIPAPDICQMMDTPQCQASRMA